MRRWSAAMAMLLAPGAAWAPDILGASYDRRTDAIVVEIAYRGMTPDHEFVVQWGPCREGGAPGLSLLALAFGSAQANDAKNKSDAQAKPSMSQSSAASAGASGSTSARYDFDKADKNKDGPLSRAELSDMMKSGSASAGAGTSRAGSTGSSAAKTPSSSGKMDDKARTSE